MKNKLIILNQTCNIKGDTIFITQEQIANIFNVERSVITKHIKNIISTNELNEKAVCARFAHTGKDGKTYHTKHYSLDMIIAVGYRVNSMKATKFRIEAIKVLREYLTKGKVSKTLETSFLASSRYFIISFYSSKIKIVFDENDNPHYSVSNIMYNLGLQPDYQIKRVQKDFLLQGKIIKLKSPSSRGFQKTLLLPVNTLNYFLDTLTLSKKQNLDDKKRKVLLLYKKECYIFINNALNNIPLNANQNLESYDSNVTKIKFRKRLQAFSDNLEREKRLNNKNTKNEMKKREEIIGALSYYLSINEIHEIFEKHDHNYDYIYHNLYTIMNCFKHSLRLGNPRAIINVGLEEDIAYILKKEDKNNSN